MLRTGSLFSGYGGLDRAVEDVFGATTAWVADIDPGSCKVLAHRYPDAPNLGDITTIDWATVEPVDIITGGSPCQDLSTAGRRAGMTDGTRSNLWVTMREAIAHVQPQFVVWENVRGALSAHSASDLEPCAGCVGDGRDKPSLRALGRVLGDLDSLGYDTERRGLRASDVGACHQRFRVFVLAWRRDVFLPHTGHGSRSPQFGQQHEIETGGAGQSGGGPNAAVGDLMLPSAVQLLPTPQATEGRKGILQPAEERASQGHQVYLSNAIGSMLPTPAAGAFNDGEDVATWQARRARVKAELGNGNGFGMPLGIAVAMLPTPSVADTQGGRKHRSGARNDELLLNGIAHHEQFGQYAPAIARQEQAFGYPAPSPTEPGKNGRPRLSAEFASWMMGLPAGWITDVPGVTRNEALKLAGNGVVPQQAAAALRDMLACVPVLDQESA